MKIVFSIATFFLLIPIMGLAQEAHAESIDFYIELGLKDAKYEQSLGTMAYEDALDFWKDQRAFESRLKQKSPAAHQNYLNGKHIAYGQHQKRCDESCGHSDLYFRQASYYAVNGSFTLNGDFAISTKKSSKAKGFR